MISCVGQCFTGGYVCDTSTFWFGHVNYLPANTALLQESFAVSSQILAVEFYLNTLFAVPPIAYVSCKFEETRFRQLISNPRLAESPIINGGPMWPGGFARLLCPAEEERERERERERRDRREKREGRERGKRRKRRGDKREEK